MSSELCFQFFGIDERPVGAGGLVLYIENGHLDAVSLYRRKGNSLVLLGEGEPIISAVREFSPDIVFLNIVLAGMDRVEISAKIKRDLEFVQIKVLLMTPSTTFSRIDLNFCRADGLIERPYDFYEVADRILHY